VWRVDSLEVARRKISVEAPRLQGPIAFLTATVGVGSCPYLEVQLRGRNDWISLGTVLTGVQGELNQREISYALASPIQALRIREREDEITHLDSLSLSWISEEGRPREIKAAEDTLLQQDGRHLILHRGEEYRVDLGNDLLADASDIRLHVSGYYDLLKSQDE
jgi:hypothetical protein